MRRRARLLIACLALAGSAFAATPPSSWRWTLPAGVAPPPVPSDNPMTAARVALGRRLFYEADLSVDGTMSCATCHGQRDSFADGAVTHPGVHGDPGLRNVPSLLNVAWASPLTWADPRLATLEQQVPVPVTGTDPVEMGMQGMEAEIARRLSKNSCYRKMFRTAFPGEREPIDLPHMARAIAAFERTMVSFATAWDRARAGGPPLPAPAQRGEALFMGAAGCSSCHAGVQLSDGRFHPFAASPRDTGLARVTGRPADAGLFRTPGLRNVALTAPYLHDGSAPTLAGAIARHGIALAPDDEAAILAFLDALTDRTLLDDPRFAAPSRRSCRVAS